jgi:hypothetical protein
MEDMCCFTAVKNGRMVVTVGVTPASASGVRLTVRASSTLDKQCPGLLVFASKRSFASTDNETLEHLGRHFVGGIVRVEEAIPKLVARLVAKLADSGTAAAFHLAQRSQRPGQNLRLSSSLPLLAVLVLVPCFLELFAVATPLIRQTPIGQLHLQIAP